MARVIVAGVGHPVGVFGRTGWLVIFPLMISSESRTGVRRVFSGVGPAPDNPGMVERRVLARTAPNRGCFGGSPGVPERKDMDLSV
jgi:hypothetical protein